MRNCWERTWLKTYTVYGFLLVYFSSQLTQPVITIFIINWPERIKSSEFRGNMAFVFCAEIFHLYSDSKFHQYSISLPCVSRLILPHITLSGKGRPGHGLLHFIYENTVLILFALDKNGVAYSKHFYCSFMCGKWFREQI